MAKIPITVIIYAGGFPAYKSDADEIAAVEMGTWNPNTPDFAASANHLKKGRYYKVYSARNMSEFVGALIHQEREIRRVVFVGHGGRSELGLSGDKTGFISKGIGFSELDAWEYTIWKRIVPKLRYSATIDLYACYIGAARNLQVAISKTFRRKVRTAVNLGPLIQWYIEWNKKGKITKRGYICTQSLLTDDKRRCLAHAKIDKALTLTVTAAPYSSPIQ